MSTILPQTSAARKAFSISQFEAVESTVARLLLAGELDDSNEEGNNTVVVEGSPLPQRFSCIATCLKGLRNNGQICYFNSIIQALASLSSLWIFLDENKEKSDFISNLLNLVKKLNGVDQGDPNKLASILLDNFSDRLHMWQQQDAHEFLLLLFEKIEKEASQSFAQGWILHSLKCASCHVVKPLQNHEFSTLALANVAGCSSIDQMLRNYTNPVRVDGVECFSCTLNSAKIFAKDELVMYEDALEYEKRRKDPDEENLQLNIQQIHSYLAGLSHVLPDDDRFEEEMNDLGADIGMKCEIQRKSFYKRELISRPPDLLVLQIHRRTLTQKIRNHVSFPLHLDLSNHLAGGNVSWVSSAGRQRDSGNTDNGENDDMVYCLASVVEHRGSAQAGHYLTYRRCGDYLVESEGTKSMWACVSDNRVQFVDWEVVAKVQAYLLFYEKI